WAIPFHRNHSVEEGSSGPCPQRLLRSAPVNGGFPHSVKIALELRGSLRKRECFARSLYRWSFEYEDLIEYVPTLSHTSVAGIVFGCFDSCECTEAKEACREKTTETSGPTASSA